MTKREGETVGENCITSALKSIQNPILFINLGSNT